jgi:hypothetical protein
VADGGARVGVGGGAGWKKARDHPDRKDRCDNHSKGPWIRRFNVPKLISDQAGGAPTAEEAQDKAHSDDDATLAEDQAENVSALRA